MVKINRRKLFPEKENNTNYTEFAIFPYPK